jgi:excisionase family DNA binding protein
MLMRIGKVAEILGTSRNTVKKYVESGHIPSVPFGRERRVREEDVWRIEENGVLIGKRVASQTVRGTGVKVLAQLRGGA